MRIFIALDIDDAIRQRLGTFLEGVREFAPEARWVRPESLHITLKFIGEKPAETVEQIQRALAGVRSPHFDINFRGYGFFPTAKSARVFWVGVDSGTATRSASQSGGRSYGKTGDSERRSCLQPSPHSCPPGRRLRDTAPARRRCAKPGLSTSAGKIGRTASVGVWYHDGPRVLSVPEPTDAGWLAIHQDRTFSVGLTHYRHRRPEGRSPLYRCLK